MTNISKLVNNLKKEYGSLSVARDKEDSNEFISTKNLALDLILGGGIALGYVVELLGLSQSGKTTLMQLLLADAQEKYNAIGIWADRENAWYNPRAEQLGINIDNVILLKPQDISQVHHLTQFLLDVLPKLKNKYVFIAIDSIAAFDDPLKAKKSDMGKKAQQVHRLFRKTLPLVNNKTAFFFSNHVTFKTGVTFGNPETSTGGEGTKFYPNYRIKLDNRKGIIDESKGKETVGNWIHAYVLKTRRGPSFREVVFPHYNDGAIPYYGGYARLLVDRNYLQPKNVKEFNSFNQVMVKYGDNSFSEFDIEKKLEEFPELLFNEYPEYKKEDDGKERDKGSETDDPELEE